MSYLTTRLQFPRNICLQVKTCPNCGIPSLAPLPFLQLALLTQRGGLTPGIGSIVYSPTCKEVYGFVQLVPQSRATPNPKKPHTSAGLGGCAVCIASIDSYLQRTI